MKRNSKRIRACTTNRKTGYGLIFIVTISGYSRSLIHSISCYKLISGSWKSAGKALGGFALGNYPL